MGLSFLQVGMLGVAGVATFSGIALASVARTTKAALPARTTTDVRTLATRERAVISDLRTFQELSAKDRIGPWAAKLKADEGMQAAALASLGRDLGAVAATTQKQSGPHVIFATSGSGATSTRPFTIPASDDAWQISWGYDCADVGGSGTFDYHVNQGTQPDYQDFGPNQLGTGGQGIEHYYDRGTFNLQVNSECSWSIQVIW